MKSIKWTSLALICMIIIGMSSCDHEHDEELSETLKEAQKIHTQFMEMAEDTEAIMNQKVKDASEDFSVALADGDTILSEKLAIANQQLATFRQKLGAWKEQVVEVPGADGHVHDENCDHGPQPTDDLTDDQILEIQKELQIQIQALSDSLKTIQVQ